MLALFGVVLEVKDKSVMYRPHLGSIKSTLDCLKPLIEDMERGSRALNRPVKELEYFRMHMEKGVELVRKCSKNGVLAKYRKKKYTNRLLELDACLQRQLNVLSVQVATHVRETTASIRSMQKMIKRIEDSGAMKNQIEMNGPCEVAESSSSDEQNAGIVEPSSPDEQNDGLVSVNKMEAADIRVEGSGEVQAQSEIPNRFVVPEPPLFTVGLDVALKEMKMKLLDEDGFTKICVFGVGGTGKTTLAKMLCHDQEVKDKFQNIFFTTASKWPNLNLIMQELYQALCSQVPTFQNEEGRRCLVVLDDVWAGSESILQEFDGLKIPKSKVLITSRYAFSGVGSEYHLKSLNYEDSISLFQLSVSLGDGSSYIPEDLLRKIVECCKGLPLAITVIGRSLCGQPIETWQKRIVEYGRGSSISDSEPEMVVCLQRSWDALNREKNIIKECFVDLASFPEGQIIPAAALIDMWTELYGIEEEFRSIANLHKLRGLANIVSREEMEADGSCSDLFVTLPRMLRGLAIHKASEDTIEQRNRLIIDIHGDNLPSWWSEQKYQPKNARLLSISTDRAFSRKWHHMQLPNLEVLVLNFQTEKYELPDFLDKVDNLKVLIATNYGSLPAELSNFQLLGSLRNLKRIRLEGVSITSITKNHIQLASLKKIAFSKCDMGQAFSNSSFKFSVAFPNLDELNVRHCDLKELPADLCNLSQLETLYISNWHRLSTLPDGIGNLSKLKRLRVRYGTNLVKFPGSIRKLKSLEVLDIAGCINIVGFPEDIGEMSRLRKLNISGCSRLKELPLSVLSLEKLQEVILDKETEDLWKPFLPRQEICRLRPLNLNISGCSKLQELPLWSLAQEVILDEETQNLWKHFPLKNKHTRVVPPVEVGSLVALDKLNRKLLKDGVSKHVECGIIGMEQNQTQTEGWCPVQDPCSLTLGFDVLDVSGEMKMEETLISELALKQTEGSGSVVKNQVAVKGISGNHSRNDIVCNTSSSAGGSQWWKAEETDELQTDEEGLETSVLRRFTFEEMKVATGNFRSDGIIGLGASGSVFKGWVDEKTLAPSKVGSGMPVAVKKLNPQSMLDFEDWKSELNFRRRTSHPNLVKLLGYCREEKEMLFVYDFMPNGSLEDHLFRRSPGIETLSWNNRLEIASGAAPCLSETSEFLSNISELKWDSQCKAVEEVETVRKPCSFKVHHSMCIELWKLVERISEIFPDIEAARPRCSTGIQALCMLNRAIEKAKQLVQYSSESSKLYLALTGDKIVSRCQNSRNLLEQSLCQIQSWVPVILVAEISKIVDDLKAATFKLDPSEDEAGKVVRELLHQGASASDSIEDSELKALKLAFVRLHITTSKEVLIEKRSIKRLLQKVGDSDPRKKQILTYFLYLFRKYGNSVVSNKTETAPVWQQGSLASENFGRDLGYNQRAEVKPHTGYGEYVAQSNMLLRAEPPEEFLCGISSRLMYDPVVIASGQTYERMWIQKWFDEGNDTCPKTNTKLAHLSLTPNVSMRELTSRWCTKYGITILNPSMQPEALSSWENSSTSIASLGSSMNDLHLQMDLSAMSFGSLDTSFNSKTEDGSSLVQIDDDSLKYRYTKQCETNLEFLSNISELKWDSQCKAVEDVQNRLKCNPQASYEMSSKNFVTPLIKFVRDAYDQDDVEAQRHGFELLSTFVRKNRNGISYLCEDAYTLLVSSLDSKVKEEGLGIMEILSVHQDCSGNISSSGALTAILKLLDSQISSIQGKALKVLYNLSINRDICSEMVSMECIPKLVPFFQDSALSGNCISILRNLCDSEAARTAIAETDGCIASIVEVLESGSKEHQEHAVDILLSLCSQRIDYCRLVMHEGVIPALVHSSTNGTERAQINAMEVLRLLRDIDYVPEQESAEPEPEPEPEPEAPIDELPRDNGNHSNGKKASKVSGLFGKKISIFSKPSSLSSKKKK